MINLKKWKTYLETTDYSENTKHAYYDSLSVFCRSYKTMNFKNFKAFKSEMMEKYAVQTVNLRILALNKYCAFINHPEWKVKSIKIQKKTFIENVITLDEYNYLLRKLKKDDREMYFLVKFMGMTGARKSEVLRFTVNDVAKGYMDIVGKGGKLRRIYIPKTLAKEINGFRQSGLLFTVSYSKVMSNFKKYAKLYKMNVKVLHPHSFRHFFALSFIEKLQDLALLADLLGHDSIETTRIYLRRTSAQQAAIVNRVVNW